MVTFKHILVVDDDPTQCAILGVYFDSLNVPRVEFAQDGVEAKQIVSQHFDSIDLIVTDLNMPKLDGIELIRDLKRVGYTGKLVLISSLDPQLLENAGNLANMHGLHYAGSIVKPLTKGALDAVLNNEVTVSADQRSASKASEVAEISAAIRNREIVPFYQPKLDLVSGEVKGAEALARWVRPDGEIVPPSSFIPVAEENGLIEALTYSMFDQVTHAMGHALSKQEKFTVAINVPPKIMQDLEFPNRVLSRLAELEVGHQNICFEVTETGLTGFDAGTLEVMSRLRVNGFGLAIDDFGTGASNISNLRQFPYTQLKIDQSFVFSLLNDKFSSETVKTSILLARQLGLCIVAEGVEDQATLQALKQLGVDEAQGYLIAKPMRIENLVSFLDQKNEVSLFKDEQRSKPTNFKQAG